MDRRRGMGFGNTIICHTALINNLKKIADEI